MSVVRPSGIVTFLFSDIEGSTRRWQDAPQSMTVAVERHDEILRTVIEGAGGYVFTTAGDSFAAAFARTGDAVRAALEIQAQLNREAWAPDAEIPVRIGLHAGEASERDGDYFGLAVNRAARLMGVANGGQIVVSDVVRELLASGDVEPHLLTDLGLHRLKDLSGSTRVWQVDPGPVAAEFPRLSSLDAFRHNLPLELEALVGREAEAARLQELVGEHRLTTVVGPGGVGKTRLALHGVAELVDDHPDGVWFIDLAPVGADVESIAAAIGRAVGFDARHGESWSDTMVASFSTKQTLLLLDNCEHVLDGVSVLARRLLTMAPQARLLATSRERLGLAEEQVVLLGPLDAGSELFTARASAVNPAFDAAASAEAIDEICRRLDGLPLAIELAAARVASLQPEEILARLDQRFRILRGRDRTVEPRHQTLAATIDWSYQQLEPVQQDLMDRLGVLTGSFDLPSAVGIAASDLDEIDVADILDELVAKSLLVTYRFGSATRYRLLDSMASYAAERLESRGVGATMRRQHAEMRAARCVRLAGLVAAGGEVEGVGAFRTVIEDALDITGAFDWACEHEPSLAEALFTSTLLFPIGERADLARAIADLYRAGRSSPWMAGLAAVDLSVRGGGEETSELVHDLLSQPDLSDHARALAMTMKAWIEVVLRNEPEAGLDAARQAMDLIPSIDDPVIAEYAHTMTIVQFAQGGEFETAVAMLDRRGPPPPPLSSAGQLRAYTDGIALRPSDLAESSRRFLEGRDAAERLGDRANLAWLDYHLAINHLVGRDNEAAAEALVAVLPGLLDRGDPLAVAFAFEDLASALSRTGRPDQAVTALAMADRERSHRGYQAYDAYIDRRQRLEARLEAELGQERYAAARAEGADLPVDEAVQFCAGFLVG